MNCDVCLTSHTPTLERVFSPRGKTSEYTVSLTKLGLTSYGNKHTTHETLVHLMCTRFSIASAQLNQSVILCTQHE